MYGVDCFEPFLCEDSSLLDPYDDGYEEKLKERRGRRMPLDQGPEDLESWKVW